jgi:hypothetical protein
LLTHPGVIRIGATGPTLMNSSSHLGAASFRSRCDHIRPRRGWPWLPALWPLAAIPALAAAGSPPAGIQLRLGRTVEITDSFRYCWFPTLHKFNNGDLLATIRMSPDENNPEGDFCAYSVSKDGGASWSERYTLGAGANVDSSYSTTPDRDDSILSLYSFVNRADPNGETRKFHTTLTRFMKSGREIWQTRDAIIELSRPAKFLPTELYPRSLVGNGAPRQGPDLPKLSDGHLLREPMVTPWGRIIRSRDGALLTTIYYISAGDKYYSLGLFRSNDDGLTWRQSSTIAAVGPDQKPWPWMGQEGPNESALVRIADGRLYVIFRTGSGGLLARTWSTDDGKTWSAPESTSLQGVAPRLLLLANGALALTTGRPGPVMILLSRDGSGSHWTDATPLFSGMSTHYTDMVELSPGHLLVIYDNVPYGWDPIPDLDLTTKNRILATFVDVVTN